MGEENLLASLIFSRQLHIEVKLYTWNELEILRIYSSLIFLSNLIAISITFAFKDEIPSPNAISKQ